MEQTEQTQQQKVQQQKKATEQKTRTFSFLIEVTKQQIGIAAYVDSDARINDDDKAKLKAIVFQVRRWGSEISGQDLEDAMEFALFKANLHDHMHSADIVQGIVSKVR